jgi:hypothetical protein
MSTFFRRLARIVIWPRITMREILDGGADRMIVPLVLLACVSSLIGDAKGNVIAAMGAADLKTWLIVAGVIVAVMILAVLLFYVFAWMAYFAGRFLEGAGEVGAVRSALAWGLAPLVWAIVYRIPAAFFGPGRLAHMQAGSDAWRIQTGELGGGCVMAALFGVLELGFLVWWLVVASRTLAEGHRFSAWRGFGTLVIVGVTPIIIVLAAVLALR